MPISVSRVPGSVTKKAPDKNETIADAFHVEKIIDGGQIDNIVIYYREYPGKWMVEFLNNGRAMFYIKFICETTQEELLRWSNPAYDYMVAKKTALWT